MTPSVEPTIARISFLLGNNPLFPWIFTSPSIKLVGECVLSRSLPPLFPELFSIHEASFFTRLMEKLNAHGVFDDMLRKYKHLFQGKMDARDAFFAIVGYMVTYDLNGWLALEPCLKEHFLTIFPLIYEIESGKTYEKPSASATSEWHKDSCKVPNDEGGVTLLGPSDELLKSFKLARENKAVSNMRTPKSARIKEGQWSEESKLPTPNFAGAEGPRKASESYGPPTSLLGSLHAAEKNMLGKQVDGETRVEIDGMKQAVPYGPAMAVDAGGVLGGTAIAREGTDVPNVATPVVDKVKPSTTPTIMTSLHSDAMAAQESAIETLSVGPDSMVELDYTDGTTRAGSQYNPEGSPQPKQSVPPPDIQVGVTGGTLPPGVRNATKSLISHLRTYLILNGESDTDLPAAGPLVAYASNGGAPDNDGYEASDTATTEWSEAGKAMQAVPRDQHGLKVKRIGEALSVLRRADALVKDLYPSFCKLNNPEALEDPDEIRDLPKVADEVFKKIVDFGRSYDDALLWVPAVIEATPGGENESVG